MRILSKIHLGLYLAFVSVKSDDNFLVVSPYTDEEFSCPGLQQIRRRQLHFPVEEDESIKDETCGAIARSDFILNTFSILPLEPKHPEVFWRTSLIKTPANITGPYGPREILIGGNISYEAVYPCVTLDYNTGNFFEIFISRQFNVSLLHLTPFRLVFKQDKTGKLVPVAIAEKPAEISKYVDVGSSEHKSIEKSGSNICNLTTSMKFRLCATILNAKKYRDEVTFSSYANIDEPQCGEQTVLFESIKYLTMGGENYEVYKSVKQNNITVWAVECNAIKNRRRVSFDVPTVYFYIFRESESHSYFIARDWGNEKKVESKCNL